MASFLPDLIPSIKSCFPSNGRSEKDQKEISEWYSRLSDPLWSNVTGDLNALDKDLTPRTFLVGNELSGADVALFAGVHQMVVSHRTPPHIR
jgi:aminoacyl tRNA synthase complex-interacting multifunctional protein 1